MLARQNHRTRFGRRQVRKFGILLHNHFLDQFSRHTSHNTCRLKGEIHKVQKDGRQIRFGGADERVTKIVEQALIEE